jgi:hypothetical protein
MPSFQNLDSRFFSEHNIPALEQRIPIARFDGQDGLIFC